MNYNLKVEFSTENDKGQTKIQRIQYLVLNEETCTSAENKLKAQLIKEGEKDFKISNVAESKISRVI